MKKEKPPTSHSTPPERDWALVLVDQRPLRRQAASECRRVLSKLEGARARWRRFDREDKPAYDRWVAVTFGPLLTTLRELETALRQRELLIHEVEIEYRYVGARSYRAAYATVMRRRHLPPRRHSDAPPEPEPPDELDDDAEIPPEEQKAMFEDFLRTFLGLDPEELAAAEYEKMFGEFQDDIRRPDPREAAPAQDSQSVAAASSDPTRLKDLYRQLVRRLHPDLRAGTEVEVSAVWHEVQEAYAAGDVPRLETLLALTDLEGRRVGAHTSLFQMRELLGDLRRSFRALQESLRDAKKNPAWNFTRAGDRTAAQARLQRQLEADLARRQRRLRQCEALLARWSRPRRRSRSGVSDLQTEFAF